MSCIGFEEAALNIPAREEHYGFSLFPECDAERVCWGRIVEKEIEKALSPPAKTAMAQKGKKFISIFIVASITYEFAGGGMGRTTKAYSVISRSHALNALLQVVDLGKLPIPPSDLTLLEISGYDTAS